MYIYIYIYVYVYRLCVLGSRRRACRAPRRSRGSSRRRAPARKDVKTTEVDALGVLTIARGCFERSG